MEASLVNNIYGIAKSLSLEEQLRLFELLRQDIDKATSIKKAQRTNITKRTSDFEHQKYLIENVFNNPKS